MMSTRSRSIALVFVLLGAVGVWASGCTRTVVRKAAVPGPVAAQNGMVVSAEADASEAGIEVLQKGGNAIDAAVATGFALAVVHPAAGNVGGGGFMVIRLRDGRTTTFDYREKAPAAATRDMYLDSTGAFVRGPSRTGHLASGVPGSPAGLILAHERYGKLPLDEVMAPAIRLAEKGYRLSRADARSFNRNYDNFARFESTKKYFTKGSPDLQYEEGELFVQKDLADVLRRIRDRGRDGFYQGKTAELIAAEMERGGGLITLEDLANYEAVEREPVESTYRGYHVISMRPPSSGGVALAQLLNAVEPYDVGEMGFHSSATVHLMGEAMRRVYADRAKWLGDPDYFDVPVDALIEKEYMQNRMLSFNPERADSSSDVTHGHPLAHESTETTHYSVVDRDGNAVSVTTTINGGYGSDVVVDGAGFFLNNEMDDFSAKPGVPNMYGLLGSEANAIEPGKRMLSSMTPTIIENPDGELFMVIGSPGGGRIITIVYQVIMNVIDHGMDIQEAVNAGRIHHQWLPDVLEYEPLALPADVQENLRDRGWDLEIDGPWGRADGIVVRHNPDGVVFKGGADPRGEDIAVGY